MIVKKGLSKENPIENKTAVALGSFDALHIGHIAIIKEMLAYAKAYDLCAAVQLFEEPPKTSEGERFCINTLEDRLGILDALGVELVIVEEFSPKLKNVGYEDFIKDYLKLRYNAKAVFAGENYRFGHKAKGDAKVLVRGCEAMGIDAKVIKCIEIDGVVSSSKIRSFIKNGEMEMAAQYMSRPYALKGEVIHGRELGRTIGFPTANMNIPRGVILPKDGVYLTRVLIEGKVRPGITNIGAKPTVGENQQNIETYIDGYTKDLYGKNITVEFLKWIRDTKKFDSLESLKSQLIKDKSEINKSLE